VIMNAQHETAEVLAASRLLIIGSTAPAQSLREDERLSIERARESHLTQKHVNTNVFSLDLIRHRYPIIHFLL
jgi:hypothetical protein